MAFSDDNLKSIEKKLAYIEEPETEFVSYTAIFISALLARLEAAEKVCQVCDDHEFNPCPGVSEGLKAWRTSCGTGDGEGK